MGAMQWLVTAPRGAWTQHGVAATTNLTQTCGRCLTQVIMTSHERNALSHCCNQEGLRHNMEPLQQLNRDKPGSWLLTWARVRGMTRAMHVRGVGGGPSNRLVHDTDNNPTVPWAP